MTLFLFWVVFNDVRAFLNPGWPFFSLLDPHLAGVRCILSFGEVVQVPFGSPWKGEIPFHDVI